MGEGQRSAEEAGGSHQVPQFSFPANGAHSEHKPGTVPGTRDALGNRANIVSVSHQINILGRQAMNQSISKQVVISQSDEEYGEKFPSQKTMRFHKIKYYSTKMKTPN